MPDATRFHPVWVSNAAGHAPGGKAQDALVWGTPCATPGAASAAGKAKLAAGAATLAFVVAEDASGKKIVLPTYTRPFSAARIVGHWLDLCAALEG